MSRELTKQERWQRYLDIADDLCDMMLPLHKKGKLNKKDVFERRAGIIAEEIKRAPNTYSGLISVEGMKQKTPTLDHFTGRKASGRLILKKIMAGHSVERIAAILAWSTRVHRVARFENEELKKVDTKKPIKSRRDVEWEYSQAVSQMVPFVARRKQKYVYNIYGIEYNSKSEAATAHNCSEQTIHNRCINNSKKWSNWKREKLHND
jgi:hypothetical protein